MKKCCGADKVKHSRCHHTHGHEHHVCGCRPARPLCRRMRKRQSQRRVCRCDFVAWPHRAGWCAKNGDGGTPLAIQQSLSWGKVSHA